MTVGLGTRIGPYEVLSPLGEGGMGIVFRARDTKLRRDVALKLLPHHLVDNPERLARFEREAHVLASLNHPNIAQIYGVEESLTNRCIVMELIQGETLEERLQRGPIPIDEVLRIAKQIAEALETAHEKGIVHRDLKPANIKVAPDTTVKVLDFGLAKASHHPQAAVLSNSPTMIGGSAPGVILGTAAYMSPEQAKGQDANHTADVWGFGCVLYEMVTGARAFGGQTAGEIIAAVLKSEPDWDRLPVDTPENLRRLLRRCLQKDRKHRLQNLGDARLEIEDAQSDASQRESLDRRAVQRTQRLVWVLGIGLLGAVAALAWLSSWPQRNALEPDRPLLRFSVDLGPEAEAGAMITAAISPDGTRIVFPWRDAGGSQILAARKLDESTVTRLAGTEGAVNPFFSPDGRWIGFVARGSLKKVLADGGAPITLASLNNPRGATWTADDSIIAPLTNRAALARIPGNGAAARLVTQLDGEELSHRWPQILPGGRAVLFTGRSPTLNSYENAAIDVVTLATKERRTLWRGGYFGRYVPSRGRRGHLLYIHEGVLFGVPFDPERLELEGTPSPVLERVAADPLSGGGQFDVSTNGTLVYLEGSGTRAWSLVTLTADGKTEAIVPNPAMYYSPRFSPDGRRLAFAIEAGNGSDIFVYDFANRSTTRLSFDQQGNIEPIWTPDGQHIVYRSIRRAALWWVRADGVGEPQRLYSSSAPAIQATAFSPDGRRLAFQEERDPSDSLDVSILPLDVSDPDHPRPGAPQRLLSTSANETLAAFSPDGQWIAYSSDESGQSEVYVRRDSEPAGKWQVSIGGGSLPMWSRTGREILYRGPGNRIMVAAYQVSGDSLVPRQPRQWSSIPTLSPGFTNLDLAPDGKRIAALLSLEPPRTGTLHVTFLLNFFDELKRSAPATEE
jgi:serine/threonine-protein kinase